MQHKYTLDHTRKGIIFGSVLLGLCIGVFVSSPLATIIKHFLFPELSLEIIIGLIGVLIALLIGFSFKIIKWYWYWADRVMAKLFGANGSME